MNVGKGNLSPNNAILHAAGKTAYKASNYF